MAANENTKFQINYKLNDGTLINLYATDVKDLETSLADLGMIATLIRTVGNDLHGGATSLQTTLVAAGVNPTVAAANVAYAKTALGAEQIASDKVCKHGHMVFKEGTGAKGPWKGWFCPAPKGTPDQCQPVFVR